MRVIVGATGEQLGVMKLSDALRRADSLGLDLVEVAPTANPPVCKIVAIGKFRYDLSKQEKDRRSSGTRLKEIKFRVNIDDHDYMTKIRHGEEFLDKGNKVRVQLQFRGREMAHQEFGMQLMHKVKQDLAGMSQVEMEPKAAGRNITIKLGQELFKDKKLDEMEQLTLTLEPKLAGRNITMTLSPLPASRRKRRFAPIGEPAEADQPNGSEAPAL